MASIDWQTTLGYAEDSAIATRKPIMLYYHDKDCISCREMERLTLSKAEIAAFVNEYLIALQVAIENKEVYDEYNIIWTPALVVLDFHGHEIQKTLGFHSPETFIARMHLGIAKVYFTVGDYDAANVHFKRLLEKFPNSTAIPEALFFHGANLARQKKDPVELKKMYEVLNQRYPEAAWTKRAAPYGYI